MRFARAAPTPLLANLPFLNTRLFRKPNACRKQGVDVADVSLSLRTRAGGDGRVQAIGARITWHLWANEVWQVHSKGGLPAVGGQVCGLQIAEKVSKAI